MKYFNLILFLFTSFSFSQTTNSVEKTIFGVQSGFLGVWAHNETKLSNQLSLRSEIGLDFGIQGNDNYTTTALIPSIRLEPRWY